MEDYKSNYLAGSQLQGPAKERKLTKHAIWHQKGVFINVPLSQKN